jgi:predicted ester cyclase
VTEPGKIAVCWTCTGTHDGEFMGQAATGKKFKVRCMNFYQIKNNQFVSDTGCPDVFGILMQTGLLPV